MTTTFHETWHSLLTAAGGQFGDWFGRNAALHYGDTAAEYQALSEGAGLVEASSRTLIALAALIGLRFCITSARTKSASSPTAQAPRLSSWMLVATSSFIP